YISSITGLQHQVKQNVVSSLTATARGLGAVAVLAWISPTVEAFFLWQAIVSLVGVTVLALVVYGVLPPAPRAARFSLPALRLVWRFAAGMTAITLLSLLLT